MKKLLLAALVVAALAALPAATAAVHHGGVATDVTIAPGTAGQDSYLLRVKVTDLASGSLLAGPTVLVAAGQPAETETTVSDTAIKVTVKGTVDTTARLASYSVVIRDGAEVVSSHAAKVTLR